MLSYFDEHNLKKIYLFAYIIIYINNKHRFPRDTELKEKRVNSLITLIQQKNTSNLTKTAVLCELHFEKNCIQKNYFSTKFLPRGFLYFIILYLYLFAPSRGQPLCFSLWINNSATLGKIKTFKFEHLFLLNQCN